MDFYTEAAHKGMQYWGDKKGKVPFALSEVPFVHDILCTNILCDRVRV